MKETPCQEASTQARDGLGLLIERLKPAVRSESQDEIGRRADAAEMLWLVLANVSGGNWTLQTPEWQEAAARWRDYYFAAIKAQPPPPLAPSERVAQAKEEADRLARSPVGDEAETRYLVMCYRALVATFIAVSEAQDARIAELEKAYYDLIMAVARKWPNETRHQTALRYITEAESITGLAAVASSPLPAPPSDPAPDVKST